MSPVVVRTQTLAEVAALPLYLTDEHKAYYNPFIGELFRAHVGKRGKKSSNARTFTHDLFVGGFCDELYPDLSTEAREQYEGILGKKVYSYLTNHSNRGSDGVQPKPSAVAKQRVYGHDIWKQENPVEFAEMMKEHEAEHPNLELNVGTRRALTIEFFRRLSKADQDKFRAMASERLKVIRALCTLTGNEKSEYIDRFFIVLTSMQKEAEQVAGIKMNAQVLYQDEQGDYNIRTVVTKSMSELEDAPEIERVISWIKGWVQDTAAQNVKTNDPQPTVYPDTTRDNFPLVPSLANLNLDKLQRILRLVFIMLWLFQGGHGKMPWELIGTNLDAWIPAHRRPAGTKLADPNDLRRPAVEAWLNYFISCQTAATQDNYIQFLQVHAGLHPIDPALSQESSRRLETTGPNKEQWVIKFDQTVTSCHTPGGVEYPDESIKYLRFLGRKKGAATAKSSMPVPLDLDVVPTDCPDLPMGRAHPMAVIDGQEKALLLKWCTALPAECGAIIAELIDAINDMQSHSPASTDYGIWVGQYASGMPTILPSSPDSLLDGLQFFMAFWLPVGYFLPLDLVETQSLLGYVHLWIDAVIKTSVIKHKATRTLIGGYNGTVWVVRAIIMVILNFAAISGDFVPPVRQPEQFDISQFPLDEYNNALSWAHQLLQAIRSSIDILASTSHSRRLEAPSPAPSQQPEPVVTQPQGLVDIPGSVSTTPKDAMPRSQATRRRAAAQTARRQGAGSESEEAKSGDSDKSSDDADFDGMDKHSGDDNSLDADGFALGEFGLEIPAGEFQPTLSSPHLGEDCFELFEPRSTSSNGRASALGPIPPLPPASFDSPPSAYPPLMTAIKTATAKVESTLREWEALAEMNAVGPGQERTARDAVAHLPSPIRPLAQFVLVRRHSWARDTSAATMVVDLMPHIAHHARAALQLDLTIGQIYSMEIRTDTMSDQERLELGTQHRRLLRGAVQLCWVYKELCAFEALSTEWINRIPSMVFATSSPLLARGPALHDAVRPLIQWAKAAHELDELSRQQRRVMWGPINRPFDTRHNRPLWYQFGNPRLKEIPKGLEESLTMISRLDGDDDDDDAGHNTPAASTPSNSMPVPTPPTPLSPIEPTPERASPALPANEAGKHDQDAELPAQSTTHKSPTSASAPRSANATPRTGSRTTRSRAAAQAAAAKLTGPSLRRRKARMSEGTVDTGSNKKTRR